MEYTKCFSKRALHFQFLENKELIYNLLNMRVLRQLQSQLMVHVVIAAGCTFFDNLYKYDLDIAINFLPSS